ncbi:MAG: hypothetical protein JWO89_495 [Verrucomicrobiaceae bacterium]|nr:hypothetical protein [Verrucomicrobiaceae bacterium]MDB6116737.1 hypothetical protein [Verrucomicrobiaceae bacterium]
MTQREQRLAMMVVIMLIIGGGWIVFSQMGKWRKSIDERDFKLSLRKTEAEELLKQKEFWNLRSEWLNSKLEVYPSRNEADDKIYELVEQTAKKQGLNLLRQLAEPEEVGGMTSATVIVEAKGPLEKVLRWLYDLQKPAAFISIKSLALKNNPEDTSLVIVSDLKIQKWYRTTPK